MIRGNSDSPLVPPIREILTIAAGPVPELQRELGEIRGIVSVFIYGSFAARMRGNEGPSPRDIDVMIIGQPTPNEVYEACERVEQVVHRPVNPTILASDEWAEESGFSQTVRSGPTVPVLGETLWPSSN